MPHRYIPIVFLLFVFSNYHAFGQVIDNTCSYKYIDPQGGFKIYTENDFPNGTDDQYTEGISVELSEPWLENFPLSKLLVDPHFSETKYALDIEQEDYTPADLKRVSIQKKGRPFAATLYLKTFSIATDTIHHQRFATTLSTGVLGPDALGGELQDEVHGLLDYVQPPGWQYQVHNDVILNYQVNYQKQLFSYSKILVFDAEGMARVGTLSDKCGAGVDIMLGHFYSPFAAFKKSKFSIYAYDNPEVDLVGYDATMEGGVLNLSSPYVIPAGKIERVTFMNRVGMVVVYKRFSLEANECFLSKEFSSGPTHWWGGIGITYTAK